MPINNKIRRIFYLSLLICILGLLALYDRSRVLSDLSDAKKILAQVRAASIADDKQRIAKFSGNQLLVYEAGKIIVETKLNTLNHVNYKTTLGNDMIVYAGKGTQPYNKMIHGGDITFKSWLGFTKSLWVNCTGLVREGVMIKD